MIVLLKIISLPIRLPVFIILAVLSGSFFTVVRTFGIVLLSAGSLVSTLIQLAAGIFSVLVIIDLINLFSDTGTSAFSTPVKDFILLGISLLIGLFGTFLPKILEFTMGLAMTIAVLLWRGAKKVLLCR